MADLDPCSVTVGFDLELVESKNGKTDFVAATLKVNDEEQETLIIPVEEK